MKGVFGKALLVAAIAFAAEAQAVQLQANNKDAVVLDQNPYWNLQLVKSSSTVYKLRGKGNVGLSGVNYGLLGIGASTYEINGDTSLTQGACNTLWGSASDTSAYVYAAYKAASQATSVSDGTPSTNIAGGSDTNFKVAVDGNPVVSVTLTLTGLTTGSAIATQMQTAINAALLAAGQGSTVTVAYGTVYTITSAASGSRSSVVVTDGATLNVADNLKIGVANAGVETAGGKGPALCVSNVSGLSTVGSTAVGNSGYMSCSATLASTTPVRLLATHSLNCTGPVIGTITETAPIGAAAIVNGDISASAGIAFSKLAALPSAQVLVGSGANVATAVAVTGDVTVSNAGVTAIASGVIVNADVNASAAIAYTKLALTGSVAVADMAPAVMVEATGTLTQANLQAIGTPITLIAAPGAGKAIIVDEIELFHDYAVAVYATGADVQFEYATSGANIALLADTFVTGGADQNAVIHPSTYDLDGSTGTGVGFDITTSVNKAVQVTGSNFTLGDATNIVKWRVRYHVVTVLN